MPVFFRSLLVLFFVSGAVGCVAPAPKAPESPKASLSILQGATGPSSTRFVVLRPSATILKYFVKLNTLDPLPLMLEKSIPSAASGFTLDHLMVQDLPKSSKYELVVESSKGETIDQREFAFLNPSKTLRIAVASCMDDSYKDVQQQIWPELLSFNPDLLLMIGDNVYVNVVGGQRVENMTAEILWRRYLETRKNLSVFHTKRLIPTIAVWDDNDYGHNNGDQSFELKSQTTELFRSYFSQSLDGENFTLGPGISSQFSVGEADIFLLDDRSFRTKDRYKHKDAAHFGKVQEDWLFANINPKKFTFLVSGDQWYGGYHPFESFEGDHPKNFKNFMERLKQKRLSKFVFVSGDRHLTEILKVPSTYELTSSGIHARVYPGAFKRDSSPNQVAGQDGEYNYMIIDLDENSMSQKTLRVRAVGLNKKIFFDKNLRIH